MILFNGLIVFAQQKDTICNETKVYQLLIKEAEENKMNKEIIQFKDSSILTKDSTIESLNEKINLYDSSLVKRTDELNQSNLDGIEKDKKIENKNKTITWLGILSLILTIIIVAK